MSNKLRGFGLLFFFLLLLFICFRYIFLIPLSLNFLGGSMIQKHFKYKPSASVTHDIITKAQRRESEINPKLDVN